MVLLLASVVVERQHGAKHLAIKVQVIMVHRKQRVPQQMPEEEEEEMVVAPAAPVMEQQVNLAPIGIQPRLPRAVAFMGSLTLVHCS